MPKYLDDEGLGIFFNEIKNLIHGPSYTQVANWMDSHPEVLLNFISIYLEDYLQDHPLTVDPTASFVAMTNPEIDEATSD